MSTKSQLTGITRSLFEWAEKLARRKTQIMVVEKRPLPFFLRMQLILADLLVFRKIRAAFGGRCTTFVTGAAPISFEILEFMWGVDLQIYEAYGMTESVAVSHMNLPGHTKLGSVGLPVGQIQQKISEDGEILIRGPSVFKGYYKNEEATKSTMYQDWLGTGDIGRIDEDGFLFITDRKKHLIITSGGKNLAPANIEKAIKSEDPLISQVHAHGDKRNYITCLIAPSPIETLQFGNYSKTTHSFYIFPIH